MNWMTDYARLLTQYCLALSENDVVLVRSTPLATPLLQALYAEILSLGANAEFLLTFDGQEKIYFDHVKDTHLTDLPHFYPYAVTHFTHSLYIDAPYDVKALSDVSPQKKSIRRDIFAPIKRMMMERSFSGDLRWALCVYPTQSMANECGMSLEAFETFVKEACFLHTPHPIEEWKALGRRQQTITDLLNTKTTIRYVSEGTDISFSTQGRTWINSDGKRNMPSGEVFTSPVESSVNGHITFTIPTVYEGQDVSDIYLEVQDGLITQWTARVGQDVLDYVFALPGARYFGEAAIGLNPHITQPIKDILFDEKMGGTIHMAVGASYPEAGGKNQSSVHWDMITDMTASGTIFADGEVIYRQGAFLPHFGIDVGIG